MFEGQTIQIQADLPQGDHHKKLIACQVACPVHTDARGYVRAIANGDFEQAYLIARAPIRLHPFVGESVARHASFRAAVAKFRAPTTTVHLSRWIGQLPFAR